MSKTTNLIVALVAVTIIAGGAVLVLSNRSKDTNNNATAGTDSSASSELADAEVAATITYTNDGFSPASVTVDSGSAIRIVNESDDIVGPSSDPHPDHNLNPELNFPEIEPGDSGTVVVTTKGTWGYHNHFLEDHHGTVIVQ